MAPGGRVEPGSSFEVLEIAADGVGVSGGDGLCEEGCEVFAGVVGGDASGRVGILEVVIECDESSQAGCVVVHADEVVEPGRFDFRPAGEHQRCGLVFFHRFRHPHREFQEAGRRFGGQWNPGHGIQHRPIAPFPSEFALFAVGVESIVEQEVEGGVVTAA